MSKKSLHLSHIGERYKDFEVRKAIEIPELQCYLRELVHLPTGALVMHLENDDPENFFCLSFRTLPDSSNGVAHILEHTVLCGSEKYPVKDPFFSMTRRSLNTFMNALTGSDFTCYPAASQVPKDFYNLLEVYLDAVFKPNLHELSFLQEGHRLEFSASNDPESPLVHKGIVFNEMKGVLASSHSRLAEAINQALYPDLTYGYNSGGDPKDIPHLTYRELCSFHEEYYHPSRCLFFFYGNMPLEGHLDFISTHALEGVKKKEQLPGLLIQPRFEDPKYLTVEFPAAEEEDLADKTLIAFAWLTCHVLKQLEVLALTILEIILMDTDASPLKIALLKSGLCKQASAHVENDVSEIPIVLTLKGCEAKDADALEQLIFDTLQKIAEEGISLEAIENAMHQLEIARSEIGGNHIPFGLSLFFRSALLKQHDCNPEDGLVIHSLFNELRKKNLEDPNFFTNLLRKYFLDNPHWVRVVMVPSKELAKQELLEEKEGLELIRSKLSPGEIKTILRNTEELAEFQKKQAEDDVELLPKIALEDVPKNVREFFLEEETVGHLKVFHHGCFTNDLLYADLHFNLPEIKLEDLPYVRLLSIVMPQMGCGGRNYVENLEYIQANVGGIGVELALHTQVEDYRQILPTISIRAKALHRKANKLFPLMKDMVEGIDLEDHSRLKEILLKHYTNLHTTLNQNALRYASHLASSALDVPSYIQNKWYGLEYYWTIRDIVENLDEKIAFIASKLESLQNLLFSSEQPDLVITCTNSFYQELKNHKFYTLSNINTKAETPWEGHYPLPIVESQGRMIASPVSFISHVIKTVPYAHPDAPALSVAAGLLENLVLHPLIREQGGAYGGGVHFHSLNGNMGFYSYRDPNISKTLAAFEKSLHEISKGVFEESDLEEAKLEVIQSMDAPVAPGSRGELAYARLKEGKTHQIRQAFRSKLLSISKQEIIDAVKEHLTPRYNTGVTVIFAGRELLEKENELLKAAHKKPFPLEVI